MIASEMLPVHRRSSR